MATKPKQDAASGRKVTTAATKETGVAEQPAKTVKKTSSGSATRKSDKMKCSTSRPSRRAPIGSGSRKASRKAATSSTGNAHWKSSSAKLPDG